MTTQALIRNADVLFLSTFEDTAALPIQPTSVLLRVVYHAQGVLKTDEISMALQDGSWRGVWTNDTADTGTVEWAILADGGNHAADQGYFTLTANRANPQ